MDCYNAAVLRLDGEVHDEHECPNAILDIELSAVELLNVYSLAGYRERKCIGIALDRG
jgi:hypothetical protein